MTNQLTGRHVLIIVVTAFAVIIAANLTMLFAATGSFPGLVVRNSYVASQGWDAEAEAQRDLGWAARVQYRAGALRIILTDQAGAPLTRAVPILTVGRPTTDTQDRALTTHAEGIGFMAPVDLGPGRWRVEIRVAEPSNFTVYAEVLVQEVN